MRQSDDLDSEQLHRRHTCSVVMTTYLYLLHDSPVMSCVFVSVTSGSWLLPEFLTWITVSFFTFPCRRLIFPTVQSAVNAALLSCQLAVMLVLMFPVDL